MSKRRIAFLLVLGILFTAAIAASICLATIIVIRQYDSSAIGMSGAGSVERDRVSPEDQIITAHHEAAHAVVGEALLPKRDFRKLEVFSRTSEGKYWGMMSWEAGGLEDDEAYQHRALAMISLAGGAAEEILFKKTPSEIDPDSDQSAFESLRYCEAAQCDCPPASKVDDQCLKNGLLKPERVLLYAQTRACVEANRGVIIKLANLVILKEEDERNAVRTLSKRDLEAFFAENRLDIEACKEQISSPVENSFKPYLPW